MKKYLFFIFTAILASMPLFSQKVEIRQINTSRTLINGELDIYLSAAGTPAEEDFTVSESSSGRLEVTSFSRTANRDAGIDFILVIDNSGSMHEESYQGSKRINQAKIALNYFLDQLNSSKDRVAVYSFNTKLKEIAGFDSAPSEKRKSISALRKPEAEQAYTELYNSLIETAAFFPETGRRRAVIVLSDGENFSIYGQTGNKHPDWGTKNPLPEEVTAVFNNAGISVDGINIADNRDTSLEHICDSTGGNFYDVRSTEDLGRVYTEIREKILDEIHLTVAAPALKTSSGKIVIEYLGSEDSRQILLPLLFGGAKILNPAVLFIILLAGLAGAALLYFISFEHPARNAQIQSLDTAQRTILNDGATIIGSDKEADHTIAGNPGIDARHATIVFDGKTDTYILISEKPVYVNNRKVKNKKLKEGDVIRIENSTVFFDKP